MHAGHFTAAELAVNSSEQRHSLLHACEQVIESAELARSASDRDCGLDPRACERHIAEAVALESQLEQGCSTIAVGLGIAGRVGASLAELIEAEMHERAQGNDHAPAGTRVERAAALMWTLVGLEAEIEREILPAYAGRLEQGRARSSRREPDRLLGAPAQGRGLRQSSSHPWAPIVESVDEAERSAGGGARASAGAARGPGRRKR